MNRRLCMAVASSLLASCATWDDPNTIAGLRHVKVEIEEARVERGIEMAMLGYQQFLEVSADSELAPEALRRLADLRIEKEYGFAPVGGAAVRPDSESLARAPAAAESDQAFERRASAPGPVLAAGIDHTLPDPDEGGADLSSENANEAIALYLRLLRDYPNYAHRDQVLYQMARAHEEIGEVEAAMAVMNRLAVEHPDSRFIDEVQFRRGEFWFTRSRYLDAEEAFRAVTARGPGSAYYEPALYKLGWTHYKQELYEDGLHSFIALLDHKFPEGTGYADITDDVERKRIDDTYRVVSFSFSYLGGPEEVTAYFQTFGERHYARDIYRNLGEHYLEKRRYADAAGAYKAYVALNPFDAVAPAFDMRVIEIYRIGGFPRLVIEANRDFAARYGLASAFWEHHPQDRHPEVIGHLKDTLRDLANHYHAQYQSPDLVEERDANFGEALVWYREFLRSFPQDAESPVLNYQLADLLLEQKDFRQAALEYERTAYDYDAHGQADASGHAAVYSWREYLATVAPEARPAVTQEVVRASIRFADVFPAHEQAALVLGGAADDLFGLEDYEQAEAVGRRVMAEFPAAGDDIRRAAALVVAHASFELGRFAAAEEAYDQVLALTPADDGERAGLVENLAAAIYRQGEEALAAGDQATAAGHFLRIAERAPGSSIRPTAEFDGAVALIALEDWERAAAVLRAFRADYPGHELQPEVTRRIAYVYRESGELGLAAAEYERMESESDDGDVRRASLAVASELYEEAGDTAAALRIYERLVAQFPQPVERALEARARMAEIHARAGDHARHRAQLELIVEGDARAGAGRTGRTRYLAATAALTLSEPAYERFAAIALVMPFDRNLARKQAAMREALDRFGALTRYEVAEVTAAATFYMAEIYRDFSESLMKSERPAELSGMELEDYELALEEQAYPFEELAISVHEKNVELLAAGIYNPWIEKSITRLAEVMPARYARAEEGGEYIRSIGSYSYDFVRQPVEEPADSGEA